MRRHFHRTEKTNNDQNYATPFRKRRREKTHSKRSMARRKGHGEATLDEVTVPAMNWRMRPDPGYAIVDYAPGHGVSKAEVRVTMCALPNEHAMFVLITCPFLVAAGIMLCKVRAAVHRAASRQSSAVARKLK